MLPLAMLLSRALMLNKIIIKKYVQNLYRSLAAGWRCAMVDAMGRAERFADFFDTFSRVSLTHSLSLIRSARGVRAVVRLLIIIRSAVYSRFGLVG